MAPSPSLLPLSLSILLAGVMAIAPPALALEESPDTPTVVFPMPSAVTNSTTVRIGGSTLMAPINRSLKQQFEEQFPGTAVQIEERGDTAAALDALVNGELDLAAIGRPLTPEEKARGLREIPISQEKVAILVDRTNPFDGSLTLEQLAQIFRGEIIDWAEVGREPGAIRIIDRPLSSETRLALKRYNLLPEGDLPESLNRIQLEDDDTNAMIRELGRDGIGYAIANQIRNQPAVKPIKIAILQTTLPGDALYPYAQVRGYAYKDETDPDVKSFLGFTSTDLGREAIATARREEAASLLKRPTVPVEVEEPGDTVAVAPPIEKAPAFSLEKVPLWVWLLIPVFPLLLFLAGLRKRRRPRPVTPRPEPTPSRPSGMATAEEDDEDFLEGWGDEDEEDAEVLAGEAVLEASPAEVAAIATTPQPVSIEEIQAAIPGLFTQGMVLFEADRFEEALPYFEQITEQQPDRADAWVIRGQILLALGQLPEALHAFEQSLGLDLSLTSAWIGKGDVLTRLNRPEEAQASYQQAAELQDVLMEPLDESLVEEALTGDVETPEEAAQAVVEEASVETVEPAIAPAAPLETPIIEPESTLLQPPVEAPEEEPAPPVEDTTEPAVEAPAVEPEVDAIVGSFVEEPQPVEAVEVDEARTVETVEVTEETAIASPPATEILVGEITSAIESTPVEEPLETPEPLVETFVPETPPLSSEVITTPDIPETVEPTPETEPVEAFAPVEPTTPTVLPSPITADALKAAVQERLRTYGKTVQGATPNEAYLALASVMGDHLLSLHTPEAALTTGNGQLITELSAEYLPGPHLKNALVSRGILDMAQQAMEDLGLNLSSLMEQEEEPGLGRGNLGRLMMDYLDSLATQDVPAIGYGLRYEYGIFDQEILDGWQVEVPDNWLLYGNPWEVERSDRTLQVPLGGHTEPYTDEQGNYRVRWVAAQTVEAQCFDTPVPGYGTDTVNLLRLWRANTEDSLCKVLYPIEGADHGLDLRLRQQFFLVSCAVQDVLRLHQESGQSWDGLPDRIVLHLNDTDTLLAIAELMRLLVDIHNLDWDTAWDLTQRTLFYTNHSLLPETLDDYWSVNLFEAELPRHLQIIYEINARFLDGLRSHTSDLNKIQRMSLIREGAERRIRFTNLACIGTHAINGVSWLHTNLLEQRILPDFYALTPDRFHNVPNGVSQRRFLAVTNPRLTDLISRYIGQEWLQNPEALSQLEPLAENDEFCQQWQQVKRAAKVDLANWVGDRLGQPINPDTLFDGQATVIHEYKRQHLNVLHILTLYHRLKMNPNLEILPRTFLFSGKASPDYTTAKLLIKLINTVAERVNQDSEVGDRLKIIFLPDFTQKLAEQIYPALDLSEHLSLAGTEAADTGNLMALLNGALIIGTPDGSNLELQDVLGENNLFRFGMTEPEASSLQEDGYRPWEFYERNTELKAAVDALVDGSLTPSDPELFRPLFNQLLSQDPYRVLADYATYIAAQEQVTYLYQQPQDWTRQSIRAVACMGQFSSDRAIQTYRQTIWQRDSRGDRLQATAAPPYG